MSATTAKTNGRARGPRVPLVNPLPAQEPEAPPALGAQPTPNLDAAVLRVQAEASKLVRNAVGQIQRRTYSYVTLTAVMDEVLPLLVGEDLLWRTYPTVLENGAPGLRYRMTHVPSSESDGDTMPMPVDPTMQALGSGITYDRRYSLLAYLGLTVDEDDDGASANTPAYEPRYSEATTAAQGTDTESERRPLAAAPKPSGRPATVKQRNRIPGRAKEANLTASQLADIILVATENEPRKMDEEAAERWLKRSLDRLPGSKAVVDAVLSGIANHPPF